MFPEGLGPRLQGLLPLSLRDLVLFSEFREALGGLKLFLLQPSERRFSLSYTSELLLERSLESLRPLALLPELLLDCAHSLVRPFDLLSLLGLGFLEPLLRCLKFMLPGLLLGAKLLLRPLALLPEGSLGVALDLGDGLLILADKLVEDLVLLLHEQKVFLVLGLELAILGGEGLILLLDPEDGRLVVFDLRLEPGNLRQEPLDLLSAEGGLGLLLAEPGGEARVFAAQEELLDLARGYRPLDPARVERPAGDLVLEVEKVLGDSLALLAELLLLFEENFFDLVFETLVFLEEPLNPAIAFAEVRVPPDEFGAETLERVVNCLHLVVQVLDVVAEEVLLVLVLLDDELRLLLLLEEPLLVFFELSLGEDGALLVVVGDFFELIDFLLLLEEGLVDLFQELLVLLLRFLEKFLVFLFEEFDLDLLLVFEDADDLLVTLAEGLVETHLHLLLATLELSVFHGRFAEFLDELVDLPGQVRLSDL